MERRRRRRKGEGSEGVSEKVQARRSGSIGRQVAVTEECIGRVAWGERGIRAIERKVCRDGTPEQERLY